MNDMDLKKAPLILFIDQDLRFFLHKALRTADFLEYSLKNRKSSIKDVIESIGIPHTETGSIIHHGKQVEFAFHAQQGQNFRIGAIKPSLDVFSSSLLRPEPLHEIKFIVDLNTGRLARLLRMAGMDTAYDPDLSDPEIAEKASNEKRILLTRDTSLLKRKHLEFARYVRAVHPEEQLKEVVDFFNLGRFIRPLTRCSLCNGLLENAEKKNILHRLQPNTVLYYEDFKICTSCEKIYWSGSHLDGILGLLKKSGI